MGLSNISLYDMQPFLGIDGKYNVYLSQTYGIIINGGSKFIQSTFRPSEKIYRVEKLCWSNSLAVLVEGYIYFITPICMKIFLFSLRQPNDHNCTNQKNREDKY